MITVEDFLLQNQEADLLRIATAGSVDDGKSTLIGRLLSDARAIYEDQLDAIRGCSQQGDNIDYSLITDGLKAERDQGITIDVAYRFFSTPRRRFIIADTPGHEQFTRNMATGASNAQLALVLIDAQKGVTLQTKRHTFISSLLGIGHFVVAVNKMDLAGYDETVFDNIVKEFRLFAAKLSLKSVSFIPLSALKGDNITEKSEKMPWYKGPPLLDHLEKIVVINERNLIDFRFPVQYTIRAEKGFRGYAGTIASGVIRLGEEVIAIPSGYRSKVKKIVTYNGDRSYAFAAQAVTILLEDDLDVGRGHLLVRPGNPPNGTLNVEANIVWMNEMPLYSGAEYLFKYCSSYIKGTVQSLKYRFDIQTLHRKTTDKFSINEIGKIVIAFHQPIFADNYSINRATGAFIVIDPATKLTLGAGMITRCDTESAVKRNTPDGKECRELSAVTYWMPLNASNVTIESLTGKLQPLLKLHWDELEKSLNFGLQIQDKEAKLMQIAQIALLANKSGISVLVLSPFPPGKAVRELLMEKLDICEDT